MRTARHIAVAGIVALIVASFFLAPQIDPAYGDIAHSPYGLAIYTLGVLLTSFVPSLITLPLVATATLVWGPWVAGGIAVFGWTIGGLVEYATARFALQSLLRWFNGGTIERHLDRVRNALRFRDVVIARLFIPALVFGAVRTNVRQFTLASIIAYVPLAAVGVGGGHIIERWIATLQPFIIPSIFIAFIFIADYLLIQKKHPRGAEEKNESSQKTAY